MYVSRSLCVLTEQTDRSSLTTLSAPCTVTPFVTSISCCTFWRGTGKIPTKSSAHCVPYLSLTTNVFIDSRRQQFGQQDVGKVRHAVSQMACITCMHANVHKPTVCRTTFETTAALNKDLEANWIQREFRWGGGGSLRFHRSLSSVEKRCLFDIEDA